MRSTDRRTLLQTAATLPLAAVAAKSAFAETPEAGEA